MKRMKPRPIANSIFVFLDTPIPIARLELVKTIKFSVVAVGLYSIFLSLFLPCSSAYLSCRSLLELETRNGTAPHRNISDDFLTCESLFSNVFYYNWLCGCDWPATGSWLANHVAIIVALCGFSWFHLLENKNIRTFRTCEQKNGGWWFAVRYYWTFVSPQGSYARSSCVILFFS